MKDMTKGGIMVVIICAVAFAFGTCTERQACDKEVASIEVGCREITRKCGNVVARCADHMRAESNEVTE